jgi:DNA-binding ferritin-like protein
MNEGYGKEAAVMWKKGYTEGQPGTINTARHMLGQLLAALRAMVWNYQTSHWQVSGDTFYGDHLLFERLYGTAHGEVDGLAEKMMGLFGKAAVEGAEQAWQMARIMQTLSEVGCPYQRGLQSEQRFQAMLSKARETLKELGQLSMGLDDLLPAMASAHDTHLYLLQQRLGGAKVAAAMRHPDLTRSLSARHTLRRVAQAIQAHPELVTRPANWWKAAARLQDAVESHGADVVAALLPRTR